MYAGSMKLFSLCSVACVIHRERERDKFFLIIFDGFSPNFVAKRRRIASFCPVENSLWDISHSCNECSSREKSGYVTIEYKHTGFIELSMVERKKKLLFEKRKGRSRAVIYLLNCELIYHNTA